MILNFSKGKYKTSILTDQLSDKPQYNESKMKSGTIGKNRHQTPLEVNRIKTLEQIIESFENQTANIDQYNLE
jgi:hypothetical protein